MPKQNDTYKELNRVVGKALHEYGMIRDGDGVAVGLSGGKDSWALLYFLTEFQKKAPIHYTIKGIHIDPGFGAGAEQSIQHYARQWGVAVRIETTDFGVLAHRDTNRENPCFLCSRWRRRRLFTVAEELGCNKLALGHTQDDLIETLFLNLFYAGEMSTMVPYQPLFGGKLSVIRPLAYAKEEALAGFAQTMQWPIVVNPCPSAGRSKRAEIKTLLRTLYQGNPKIRGNIFRAMRHIKMDYLLKP